MNDAKHLKRACMCGPIECQNQTIVCLIVYMIISVFVGGGFEVRVRVVPQARPLASVWL